MAQIRQTKFLTKSGCISHILFIIRVILNFLSYENIMKTTPFIERSVLILPKLPLLCKK